MSDSRDIQYIIIPKVKFTTDQYDKQIDEFLSHLRDVHKISYSRCMMCCAFFPEDEGESCECDNSICPSCAGELIPRCVCQTSKMGKCVNCDCVRVEGKKLFLHNLTCCSTCEENNWYGCKCNGELEMKYPVKCAEC